MHVSRIPDFANKTREGMTIWFSEMALRGLLFHPEDRPSDVISGSSGKALFKQDECARLDTIMAEMFDKHGDGVCEAAYPIFMRAAGSLRRN